MADYIFIRKSRNALSSLLHIVLNLLLATVSIGATVVTGSYLIGLILVVASKWRIFAVNHRYWLVNVRSNLVDLIVGISLVLLAYSAGTDFLIVHFVLMAIYAIWLIFIKPRSTALFTTIQALIAVFLGTTAASVFSAVTNSAVLVIAEFIIGFAASNHVLIQNEKSDSVFVSLICGLFFSEIAWLSHTWLIIYPFGKTGICISQLSLILSVLTFAYFKLYQEATRSTDKFHFRNVALPVLFSIAIIAVLLIGFSQPRFNIH